MANLTDGGVPAQQTALEAAKRYIHFLTSNSAGYRVDIYDAIETAKHRYERALAAIPAEGRPDWKAMDRLEDAAEAIFKILSPGLPYTAEDAFWYRQAAHAVLDRCSPAAIDRNAVIEECAKVLDDAAHDWNRIRDPGMANNARSYAKKIRALVGRSQPATDSEQLRTARFDDVSCGKPGGCEWPECNCKDRNTRPDDGDDAGAGCERRSAQRLDRAKPGG